MTLRALGYFTTKIFHPNVSQAGEICVNTLMKDWKSSLGLKHILLVSRDFFPHHVNNNAFYSVYDNSENRRRLNAC